MPKVKVWTKCYRPFMMGGNVHVSIAAMVEALGPFDLGKGYKGYLVSSPKGQTYVAEAETGAFVGFDLETVREDVKSADDRVMKQQIEEAKEMVKEATMDTEENFWSMFKD